jgi:hypothetical protein
MGHVKEPEKYEWVSWKVCVRLCNIDGGSVWWLFKKGMEGGSFLGSSFIIRLTSMSISMEKSWVRRKMIWLIVDLNFEYFSYSHIT